MTLKQHVIIATVQWTECFGMNVKSSMANNRDPFIYYFQKRRIWLSACVNNIHIPQIHISCACYTSVAIVKRCQSFAFEDS